MIFIWIPKTGGTAFAKTNDLTIITEFNPMPVYTFEKGVTFGHSSPQALLQSGTIHPTTWRTERIVTLVRNPYDRFKSLYYDYKKSGRISQDLSQREFAHAIKEMRPLPGLYNSDHLSMCAPQVTWIVPGMQIYKLEDMQQMQSLNVNPESRNSTLDKDAIHLIKAIYVMDFVSLGYEF